MKFRLKSAVAAAALVIGTMAATPAMAADPPNGTDIGGCSLSLPTPDAIDCAGYFTGNILNGSSEDVLNQQNAIASLDGPFVWDGNWSAMDASVSPDLVITALTGGNQLNFGTTLFGLTIIGAHFGNIFGETDDPDVGNVSVFWLFDFGTTGVSGVTLDNVEGFSNAALYSTGPEGTPRSVVPEPATWAMMLLGFGAAGYALRRRRKVLLTQVA